MSLTLVPLSYNDSNLAFYNVLQEIARHDTPIQKITLSQK
jgi:hypothetical protein